MEVIEDYFYTKEHEWVRIDDNIATVGISEYAQSALGDITFVELPEEGLEVEQFEQFASVESVKAASDIYCPMSGTVIEVNEELDSSPDLVNRDCYEKAWLVKIEISTLEDKANLMTSVEYQKFLESLE